jgi:rare lipoprotein A (peptidoglycan hydrolase)
MSQKNLFAIVALSTSFLGLYIILHNVGHNYKTANFEGESKSTKISSDNYDDTSDSKSSDRHTSNTNGKNNESYINISNIGLENSVINHQLQGLASWYGPYFHGRKTASGNIFNQYALTAAHKTLPLGTIVKVTNIKNTRSVVVKINDRGPYIDGRVIDMSKTAAEELKMLDGGIAPVKIDVLKRTSDVIASDNEIFDSP